MTPASKERYVRPGPRDRSRRLASTARETGGSIYDRTQQTLLTGIAITIPVIVTLYIPTVALDFVSGALDPFIALLRWFGIIEQFERVRFVSLLIEVGIDPYVVDFFTELVTLLVLFLLVAAIGTVGRNRYGERLVDAFDYLFSIVPGLGSVYRGFRRMGDAVLESEAENFRSVKLVEFPDEGSYSIAFLTADTPEAIDAPRQHTESISELFRELEADGLQNRSQLDTRLRKTDCSNTQQKLLTAVYEQYQRLGDDLTHPAAMPRNEKLAAVARSASARVIVTMLCFLFICFLHGFATSIG